MAGKRAAAEPQKILVELRPDQIPGAIAKLERRLKDFKEADPSGHTENVWPFAEGLCARLSSTLQEIYGLHSIQLGRVETHASSFVVTYIGGRASAHERIQAFEYGRKLAVSRIETELSILRELLQDHGAGDKKDPLKAYGGLDLHPQINEAAGELFRDGHYASAIEDAVKALNAYVRFKSGVELDGNKLMEVVFNPSKPVLRFNDLADDSDRDEQKGFMLMFSGAVAGLRNPRAHKLIKDDPERALEFIAFVSLLAKLTDGATKVRPT
jgi:uncharacterized protein (TIGR02391 family)